MCRGKTQDEIAVDRKLQLALVTKLDAILGH